MNIQKNISLAKYTTFKIGGPAENFVEVKDVLELQEVLKWAEENKQLITIIGGGSNLLISDKGLKGLVVKLCLDHLEFKQNKIIVAAGVNLAYLLNQSFSHGLVGLEFAAGVPGTVGGAVRGNAGTFGTGIGDVVKKIKYLDENYQVAEMTAAKAKFEYRHSIFKDKPWIVLEVELELKEGDVQASQKLIKERLDRRKETQPHQASAGCIFKNVDFKDLNLKNLEKRGLELDKFTKTKQIPAAYLIDQAGLKGHTIGDAQVSELHTNYIINKGEATAEQVIILISFIKQQIRNKYGLQLKEEVQILL
ncbi:UDP-N-acetylmuramate dehydrogenase [bacterium]|nr:UDP-N-acetylmuramate dehydrogenase [bacterium]